MIKSMTGFVTKRVFLQDLGEITINIRSLNFKYVDIHLSRIPQGLEELERLIYEDVIQKIKRGRLDIFIGINPEILVRPSKQKISKIRNSFRKALDELTEFKKLQGQAIKGQIKALANALKKRSDFFIKHSKKILLARQEKQDSVKDIFEETSLIAFYLKHLAEILDKEKNELGKILDFLSQELLREANTILAKVKDRRFSLEAVYFKEEIDRLRELAANIE